MPSTLDLLNRACDGHVTEATDADAVLGARPRWVVSPASADQVAATMRAVSGADLAVVVRGQGTKLAWGSEPERLDVLLDTTRLDSLVAHEAGDLTLVAGAGRPLATLQADVAVAGQRLGIDPARSGTIGGAVATATSGPLRLHHGAVRDLVIGMRLVRADGVAAHSGGTVVKNVAGYDLGKLLTGSFGTLGVITEVALRLHPRPQERRWVACEVADPAQAHRAVQALVHSQLVPVAVEVDLAGGRGSVVALLEGHADGTQEGAEQAALLLGAATVSDEAPPWWGSDLTGAPTLLKVTHEIAGLPHLLTALQEVESRGAVTAHLRGSAGVGVAQVALSGDDPGVMEAISALRAASAGFGGSVVVLETSAEVRSQVDVWGPVTALGLMRAVKDRFDPGRVLSPGRFVGGI